MSEDIWQRFTSSAQRVVQHAQDEAKRLGSSTVGTEHILLGLVRDGTGVGARVLDKLGVTLARVRQEVHKEVPPGPPVTPAALHWGPRTKRALQLALDEARELNPKLGLPNYIDTEHLLLALIREGEGQAVRILHALGVDPERVRREVLRQLGGAPAVASSGRRRLAGSPPRLLSELRFFAGAAMFVMGAWIMFRYAPDPAPGEGR